MASKSFTNVDVESMQHNVQKSDPFLEKLLLEACCEISEKSLQKVCKTWVPVGCFVLRLK